jgi:hypothetical protein
LSANPQANKTDKKIKIILGKSDMPPYVINKGNT